MNRYSFTLVAAIVSSLFGCAVGPDYKQPATPESAGTPFLGASAPQFSQTGDVPAQWWHLYDDPVVNGLVSDALRANTDLRVAVAHLEKARALRAGAQSEQLPQTTLGSSSTYGQTADIDTLPGAPRRTWRLDEGLTVSYEVDLFGRVRRDVEAARADEAAAAADADAVRVTVVSDTLKAYASAVGYAQQLAVAKQTVDLLNRSIQITQARVDAGRSQRLDVIRLTVIRDQRAAQVPSLGAAHQAALFRLAMLTGRTPAELPPALASVSTLPQLNQPIPVGDGRALLARRPDVREAERRLAANTARIGVETAGFYPSISLGAQGGSVSTDFANAFTGGALRWLVGPLISWNFPNIEGTRAKVAAARGESKASLAAFDGAVLTALQETETALTVYQHLVLSQASITAEKDGALKAANAVQARQQDGSADFLEVLEAQRTLADVLAENAKSQSQIALAQIDVFKALGGGWQQSSETVSSAFEPSRQ